MSQIREISVALPATVETNEQLSLLFPEWSVEKIAEKTGITHRHIAGPNEFTSDLATAAAQALIHDHNIGTDAIDFVILVTQSPDFALPSTACLVHAALNLREDAGAVDVNMGCSGYIYGLRFASALIDSGQALNVLLLTSDTYSKYLNPKDKTVRTIFGDGATASLISKSESSNLKGFFFGTNGKGAANLIVPNGGLRHGGALTPLASSEQRELPEHHYNLFMNGAEIFNFTIDVADSAMREVLSRSEMEFEEVDHFVFHQANKFMLTHLRKKLGIPEEKFPILMSSWGNTVSGTIPMALNEMRASGALRPGDKCLLLGFGVGLSWAGCTFIEEL